MTVTLENELITGILNEEIKLETIFNTNLEPRWLKFNREIYEYIINYQQKYNKIPTKDLVLTAYPYFEEQSLKTEPLELIEALNRGTKNDRYIQDLNAAIKLFRDNGDLDKSKQYLVDTLWKYEEEQKDVFDLSSDEDLNTLLDFYKKRREARLDNGSVGIRSGFGKEFDEWLHGGWQNGNFYGILAASGVGKTWASIVSGTESLKQKKTPLVLCLEGGLEKEGFRILTVGTEIANDGLHAGTLEEDEVKWAAKRLQTIAKENNAKYYLAIRGNRIAYTIYTLWQKVAKYKPDILIVDYLGLMTDEKGTNSWEVQEQISNGLKSLAVAFDIPVIATFQANKASEFKKKLDKSSSSYYAVLRAMDGAIGISKLKKYNFLIRINDVKGRDAISEFDAVYQTSWNKGIVKFINYWSDSEFKDDTDDDESAGEF